MRVTVHTDEGEQIGVIEVDSHHGPWADDWQYDKQYEFREAMNEAARKEGGE